MRLTGMQRNIPPNKQSFTHSPIFVSGEAVANLVGANLSYSPLKYGSFWINNTSRQSRRSRFIVLTADLSAPKLSSSSHLQNISFTQVRIQIDMPHFAWYTTHRTSKERSIPMRTQSEDTSPEMERVQIELIRKASIAKRFAIMQAWSQLLIEANKQRIHKDHPDASEEEISLIFVARHYGQALADGLRADMARRQR